MLSQTKEKEKEKKRKKWSGRQNASRQARSEGSILSSAMELTVAYSPCKDCASDLLKIN